MPAADEDQRLANRFGFCQGITQCPDQEFGFTVKRFQSVFILLIRSIRVPKRRGKEFSTDEKDEKDETD